MKPAVGDEYTYAGVKWVVAVISGNICTLLYHDAKLSPMPWGANSSKCEVTANQDQPGGLKANILTKVPGSTLGADDVLFLPSTGNVGSPAGSAYDPDAGQDCWELFRNTSNVNTQRINYIMNYASFANYDEVWLSTVKSRASSVFSIHSDGSLADGGNPSGSLGIVPALQITFYAPEQPVTRIDVTLHSGSSTEFAGKTCTLSAAVSPANADKAAAGRVKPAPCRVPFRRATTTRQTRRFPGAPAIRTQPR